MRKSWIVGIVCVVALSLCPAARAGVDGEFAFSLGYSHLNISGATRMDDQDGFRIEPRVSFAFIHELPQLRMGFGLGLSGYSRDLDTDTVITIDNGNETTVIFADQFENISLLEPEFQLSWRQP